MSEPLNYSSVTPRVGFPMLFVGQAQKETTVNEALLLLDIVLGAGILGVRNDPPASPAHGDVWIVGAAPTGEYAGHSNALAGWTEGGWRYIAPRNGWRVLNSATSKALLFHNAWQSAMEPPAPTGGTTVDLEARSAVNGLIQALKAAGIFSVSE